MDKIGISMLRYSGIDVDNALQRFNFNIDLYDKYLKEFVNDNTFDVMVAHIKMKNFDEGFNSCHALKGVTGNLGFTELFDSCDKLCKALKSGELNSIADACQEAQERYSAIIKILGEI